MDIIILLAFGLLVMSPFIALFVLGMRAGSRPTRTIREGNKRARALRIQCESHTL